MQKRDIMKQGCQAEMPPCDIPADVSKNIVSTELLQLPKYMTYNYRMGSMTYNYRTGCICIYYFIISITSFVMKVKQHFSHD